MWLPILFLCIFAFFYFYLYLKKCCNYWRYRGVAQVDTHFLFGMFFDNWMGRRSLTEVCEDIYKAEPGEPFVGVYYKLEPVLFIRDPELIHKMTVTNFDNFRDKARSAVIGSPSSYRIDVMKGESLWKLISDKILPVFTSSTAEKIYKQIEESAEKLIEKHHRPGELVNVRDAPSRFVLDVTAEYTLGVRNIPAKLEAGNNYSPFKEIFKVVLESVSPYLTKFFDDDPPISPDFVHKLTHEMEEKRRKERREDFFQSLLDAKSHGENADKSSCTEMHVTANVLAGLLGFDPTASVIAFALYELAMQPEIQEKLRREIQKAREANDGIMDSKSINEIEYLEMVVSEAFRLHPPVSFSGRTCTKNYRVPGSKLEIKVGQQVIYSYWALHRDERFFPDPLRFNPDRFSAENRSKINPYTFLPFGSGPRACVAKPFVYLAMKIYLVSILSRFKLLPCNKTERPVNLKKDGMIHSPQNGIWLTIENLDHRDENRTNKSRKMKIF